MDVGFLFDCCDLCGLVGLFGWVVVVDCCFVGVGCGGVGDECGNGEWCGECV